MIKTYNDCHHSIPGHIYQKIKEFNRSNVQKSELISFSTRFQSRSPLPLSLFQELRKTVILKFKFFSMKFRVALKETKMFTLKILFINN